MKQKINPKSAQRLAAAIFGGGAFPDKFSPRVAVPLEKLLKTISPLQAYVLALRFGLYDNNSPLTLAEVGIEIGRTRERARQIQHQAIKRLRYFKRIDQLRPYYYRESLPVNREQLMRALLIEQSKADRAEPALSGTSSSPSFVEPPAFSPAASSIKKVNK